MDETKNSRRAATEAGSGSDFPSKNSRRGIGSKNGAPEGDPSGTTPSTPSKNSRRGTGAKTGRPEVTPSTTPTDAARYDGIAPSEPESNDGKATATTLHEGGQNSPIPAGGVAPPERPDMPRGRERLAGADGKQALTGGQHPTPSHDGRHDESDSPANIAELSAKVEAMKRKQRASAIRGALLVFMPPVVLCVPLFILKGCNLLLLSWWWCVSPLILWAFPIGGILSIFVQCYRLFRQQDKAAQDTE